jgi:uncharacterized protein (DUF1810 family)
MPFIDLSRYVAAQAGTYDAALAEVRRGRKSSHWMWFVFPQLRGLGRSETSIHYGIGDLEEARAYVADPVLGPRLREIAAATLAAPPGHSATDVFGPIDSMKLRSSMTLFAHVDPDEPVFRAVLDRFFGSVPDPETLELIGVDG